MCLKRTTFFRSYSISSLRSHFEIFYVPIIIWQIKLSYVQVLFFPMVVFWAAIKRSIWPSCLIWTHTVFTKWTTKWVGQMDHPNIGNNYRQLHVYLSIQPLLYLQWQLIQIPLSTDKETFRFNVMVHLALTGDGPFDPNWGLNGPQKH